MPYVRPVRDDEPSRPPTRHAPLIRRLMLAAVSAAAVAVAAVLVAPSASAATLLSDNFEDGNADGWSKSGGDWSVVSDGSQALRQSKLDSELAREFAGSTSWTNYTVQARVKPLAFDGSARYVGIAARASGSTKFYRLALLNTNRAELQAVNGSSVTVIGGVSRTVSTGTWYTLRIDVSGTTIRGFVDGAQFASGSNSLEDAGRVGLQTFHATASFDDVVVSDTATTPTTSTTSQPPTGTTTTTTSRPPTTTTSQPPPPPPGGLVGWATQGGGTTGGAGGATVTVTSLSALTTAAASTSAQVIRVSGMFSCSEDVRVASNKTILGVGSNSGLNGCGLNIRDVSNVIVRNLRIGFVQAGNGNGDAIHIDHATRIWIDHNDLSSDRTHGTDFYDGLVDMTHAADFITVSWNFIHDHIKCALIGHSDSNASEDVGHLRISYHHNFVSNCDSRNPRVRFGNPIHVFNNYYANIADYAVASTIQGGVLVEGNYFENVPDPFHLGEGSSPAGSLVARNNFFVNSGSGQTGGSVAGIPYGYTLDAASSVKSIVQSGAGVGKIAT